MNNVDPTPVPDKSPKDLHPEVSAEPDTVADKKKLTWTSTVFATAKLLLRGVRDTADAFGPLKSVAGGLCFILENCEVWPICVHPSTTLISSPAYEGEWPSDSFAGTTGEGTCWTAPGTHS